uniref:O-fucosyltransferase family protein n=1 Tax=Chaetoceros debilis TaxID=122233 RepID=A0A7S3VAP8_9STRA
MRRQTSYNSAHIQSRSNSRILSVPRLTKIKKAPRKCCPKSSYLVCVVLLALSISWLNIERTNGETSSEAKKLHAEISASAIVPKSNVVAKVDVDLAESEEAKDQNNFFIPLYHRESYEKEIKSALKPLESAVNTTAAYKHQFWSGFCNQRMMFLGVLFLAQDTNSTQILVESIKWKDQFGTNERIRHDHLFDTVHWNSFHPKLPRMALHSETLFPDVSIKNRGSNINVSPGIEWEVVGDPFVNATRPYPIGKKQTEAVHKYLSHNNRVYRMGIERRSIELEVMKGALRPHPAIEDIIQEFIFDLQKLHETNYVTEESSFHTPYMVLHARIEPDMQQHGACSDKKVYNLTDIVSQIETKFVDPPTGIQIMVIILHRELLEKEVTDASIENEMAGYNLKALNELIENGLWGGKVRVVEAGSKLAQQQIKYPFYAKYSAIVGAIINYYLSIDASIFFGTYVSSYSSAVISTRFFRETITSTNNYFYSNDGLIHVTPPGAAQPPKFQC